jgi:hypothetical protein
MFFTTNANTQNINNRKIVRRVLSFSAARLLILSNDHTASKSVTKDFFKRNIVHILEAFWKLAPCIAAFHMISPISPLLNLCSESFVSTSDVYFSVAVAESSHKK